MHEFGPDPVLARIWGADTCFGLSVWHRLSPECQRSLAAGLRAGLRTPVGPPVHPGRPARAELCFARCFGRTRPGTDCCWVHSWTRTILHSSKGTQTWQWEQQGCVPPQSGGRSPRPRGPHLLERTPVWVWGPPQMQEGLASRAFTSYSHFQKQPCSEAPGGRQFGAMLARGPQGPLPPPPFLGPPAVCPLNGGHQVILAPSPSSERLILVLLPASSGSPGAPRGPQGGGIPKEG